MLDKIIETYQRCDSCALDFLFAATRFPWGFAKPRVVRGYFENTPEGNDQKIFYEVLLQNGFQRTFFQLIFPNQTAGLIKKLEGDSEGIAEYHVRFYPGCIDIELEYGRFSSEHFSGGARHDRTYLELILDDLDLDSDFGSRIKTQFGERDYSFHCNRPLIQGWDIDPETINKKLDFGLSLGQYGLLTLGTVDAIQSLFTGSSVFNLFGGDHSLLETLFYDIGTICGGLVIHPVRNLMKYLLGKPSDVSVVGRNQTSISTPTGQ